MNDMVSTRKRRGLAESLSFFGAFETSGECSLLGSDTGDFFREGKQIV
jgi:hypothetical protein